MAEKIMQGIKQISELIGQAVKKRVVCLYRVSTVGQVEKDDIPMQKQYCREFCRGQSGWEIVKEFSEKRSFRLQSLRQGQRRNTGNPKNGLERRV